MENNRKLMLVLLIGISLAAVALIIYFMFFYDFNRQAAAPAPVSENQTPVSNVKTAAPRATATAPIIAAPSREQLVGEDAAQIARIFAERFGTWSNQGGADQFADLKFFATRQFMDWIEANKTSIVKESDNYQNYYGLITKSVTSQIVELAEAVGSAKVIVNTQRTEERAGSQPRIFNQNLQVELVKSGKRWLVNSATWQ